jgi:hypothetical protein
MPIRDNKTLQNPLETGLVRDANNKLVRFHGILYDDEFIKTVDYLHYKVENGELYSVAHVFESIGAGDSAYLLIKVAAGYNPDIIYEISSTADAISFLHEGALISANGTQLTVFNHDRDNGDDPVGIDIYHTPTVDSAIAQATLRQELLPAGSGRDGGFAGMQKHEYILSASTDYLIEVTNETETACDIGVALMFYFRS